MELARTEPNTDTVKSKWLKYSGYNPGFFLNIHYVCHFCGEKCPIIPVSRNKLIVKYCPSCGENMEEVDGIS